MIEMCYVEIWRVTDDRLSIGGSNVTGVAITISGVANRKNERLWNALMQNLKSNYNSSIYNLRN